ncbi:CaiB/BaiF CoA-transferase family protein [Dechloromonas sp. HYN0024]|uniref:CaiB/BaiF CoA transferase family protein n=1 Tax=Dechloromonas sp. HYN0024 TaxID=2231055 RepID=UPI000E446270|nr:CaiB/BaiF CoA-transferase family protein [Dechloromonas sp. HYN0024]AXS79551.1 CoA transferase [Dechloromonas sp. HYN0024]
MQINSGNPLRGPLAGIKVVEFAGIGPGPFCGMLLADMGADVTLLERAGGTFASQLFGGGRKAVANRGKKSLCIDLKHPEAKTLVNKLIAEADVLIEGFRPGVMERLGFGPDACLAINPRLIYGRMTGWGQTGPLAPRAGHDANYAAIAGVLDTGRRHGGAPWAPPTLVGDMGGGGLMLAWGIACALIETQRSGQGQVIDAAMCEGAAVLAHGLFNLEALGEWQGQCAIDSSAPFYDVYQCADGEWISVCPLEPQFYSTFIERLGLSGDPDFNGKQYDTSRWPVMKDRLTAIFKSAPRDHWDTLFNDTDDCVWPVLSMGDAPAHPHNVARQAFVDIAGIRQPAPAPRLSRTPGDIQSPPPLLGEHSRQQLSSLGLPDEEIERLARAGVISDPVSP